MSFDGVVINIASEVSESENIITKAEARVLLTLLHEYFYDEDSYKLHEAKYRGRKVKLNKPKRGGPKKFYVYVRNPKTGKVKRVTFGAKGMTTGLRDPKRSKSFELRHRCKQKKDKTKITLVTDTSATELVQNETEDGTKKKPRRKGWWSRRESNE